MEAQVTFNHRFHFGFLSATLTSIIPTDSCYYATGIIADTIPPHRTGNIFIKFDLQGNPLYQKTITNSSKTYETWENTFISTLDGGFVTCGYSFDPDMKALFIKYNENGDTIFTREYLNPFYPEEQFIRPMDFAATLDGGYVFVNWLGTLTLGNTDVSVIKIDSLGTVQWHKIFGNNLREIPKSISVDTNGDIIVGALRANNNLVAENYTYQVYILKLDSSGNSKWTYLSPLQAGLRDAANDFVTLEDGNLVIASGVGIEQVLSSVNEVWFHKNLFKLALDKNISWEIVFKEPEISGLAQTHSVIKISDNSGYVAIGTSWIQTDFDKWTVRGWIGKISIEGKIIWEREYTILETEKNYHTPFDLKETPDGGFVICGQATNWSSTDSIPQQAWLLKLDQHGCLVPGCYTDTEDLPGAEPAIRLSIYPNPATDYLNFYLRTPRPVREAAFRIVNTEGKLMHSFKSDRPEATFIVPVWEWAAGVYFLQYMEDGIVRVSERFVIAR